MKKKIRISILVILGLIIAFAVYGKFSFQSAPGFAALFTNYRISHYGERKRHSSFCKRSRHH